MTWAPHDHEVLGPPRVEEVSEGVFAYIQPDGSWCLNNCGFVVGRDAVVAVDACSTERRTRAFLNAVAEVSRSPVRTLVNTHSHLDHTNGNCFFAPSTTIVAHEDCRTEVLAAPLPVTGSGPFPAVDWGAVTKAPPTLTFSDAVTIWVDDLACEVRFVGTPAHTTNDAYVWLPERSVLFAGDLVFNGGTPFNLAGSIAGALRVIDDIRALGPAVIVPGHGDVCDVAVLEGIEAYLRFVSATAVRGREAGLSPLEVARETGLGPFADLLDPERFVGNLHRAYMELEGAPLGAPVDPRAFLDMLEYNGGRPLRCLA